MDRGRALLRALCGDGDPPRVLVVAAHPDDETIGAAARLACLPRVRVLHLTDGAPADRALWPGGFAGSRAEYAATRRSEALEALALAGMRGDQVACAGAGDQGASRAMAPLARKVAGEARRCGASVVLTHAYEGGHPDHDAASFCSWAAARLLGACGAAPVVVEMTSYHAGDGDEPVRQAFLPSAGAGAGRGDAEALLPLSGAEQALKRAMLACFRSQRAVLEPFGVSDERFRLAPPIDFEAPPHAGPLWYERLGWTMTGDAWRGLARSAQRALFE
jgi:LmbE family N-acetylglucosaminyl deacetylase